MYHRASVPTQVRRWRQSSPGICTILIQYTILIHGNSQVQISDPASHSGVKVASPSQNHTTPHQQPPN